MQTFSIRENKFPQKLLKFERLQLSTTFIDKTLFTPLS